MPQYACDKCGQWIIGNHKPPKGNRRCPDCLPKKRKKPDTDATPPASPDPKKEPKEA